MRKIKLSAAILLAALAITLSGCGDSQKTDTASTPAGDAPPAAETRADASAPAAAVTDGEASADGRSEAEETGTPDHEDGTSAPDSAGSRDDGQGETQPPAAEPTEPASEADGEIDNAEVNINDL